MKMRNVFQIAGYFVIQNLNPTAVQSHYFLLGMLHFVSNVLA